jgi:L-ribulose-5-phosphate 4-epimerase
MRSFDAYKQQVVTTCQVLVAKGYLIGTGGNISVRVPGEDAFAITPSNYDYTKMLAEDICVLSLSGEVLEGSLKPSVENGMHAAIYEQRADTNVVIHTHQIYASAFALINQPIPALYDEQVRFLGRSVEIVSYAPSGTGFLKKNLVSRLKNNCNAYILQNHGAVCLGGDADRAIFNVELLEKCALTYLLALTTEQKVTRIPLPIREIAFSKLRKDQKRLGAENIALNATAAARKGTTAHE